MTPRCPICGEEFDADGECDRCAMVAFDEWAELSNQQEDDDGNYCPQA